MTKNYVKRDRSLSVKSHYFPIHIESTFQGIKYADKFQLSGLVVELPFETFVDILWLYVLLQNAMVRKECWERT